MESSPSLPFEVVRTYLPQEVSIWKLVTREGRDSLLEKPNFPPLCPGTPGFLWLSAVMPLAVGWEEREANEQRGNVGQLQKHSWEGGCTEPCDLLYLHRMWGRSQENTTVMSFRIEPKPLRKPHPPPGVWFFLFFPPWTHTSLADT